MFRFTNTKIQNICLLAAGFLVAVVLAEVFIRAVLPDPVVKDPVLGFKHRSGFGWDANGFKNSKALDKAEIVAIGDSQTEGNNASIEDSWPQVLGRLSNKIVYQMALGGYSPVQYSYLFDKALQMNPKIIIVGFYAGNDLLEAQNIVYSNDSWADLRSKGFVEPTLDKQSSDTRLIFQSGLSADSFGLKLLKFRNWLRSKSKLYTFLGQSTRALREKLNLAETKEERIERIKKWAAENPDVAVFYSKEGIETLLSPAYRLDAVDLEGNVLAREGWRITKMVFEMMNKKAQEQNVKLVLVFIPTKELVYDSMPDLLVLGEKAKNYLDSYAAKELNLRQEFLDFCKRSRIACFDATGSLVEALKSGRVIYPHTTDGHPVAEGYKVIAEGIFKFLQDVN